MPKCQVEEKNIEFATYLAIILPFIVMLNIGLGWRSLVFLSIRVLGWLLALLLLHFGLFKNSSTLEVILTIQVFLNVYAACYCNHVLNKSKGIIKKRWSTRWYNIIIILTLILSIIYGIRTFVIDYFYINGSGLEPRIKNSEYVIITKPTIKIITSLITGSNLSTPHQKSDIFIANCSFGYCAREIIGTANDQVIITGNKIFVENVDVFPMKNCEFKAYNYQLSKTLNHHNNNYIMQNGKILLKIGCHLELEQTVNLIGKVKFSLWNLEERKFTFRRI